MKKLGILLSFLVSLIILPVISHAESPEKQLFTVQPILPSNQDTYINNYFSITTKGNGLTQTLEFLVTNKTNSDLTLKIKPFNGLTSPNGVIQYKENMIVDNAMLIDEKYSLPMYMNVVDQITLGPSETKKVQVELDVFGIQGTILGGVAFQSEIPGMVERDDNVQFRIINEMNNIVGIVLNFDGIGVPSFIFGDAFVSPLPAYYAVRLPVTFDSATLLKNVSLEYEVLDEERRQLFKPKTERIFNFAPKSKANVIFPWEAATIEKGKTYILKGAFIYQDTNGEQVRVPFESPFEYTGDETPNDNQFGDLGKPSINESFNWLWLLLGLLILLLLIGFLLLLMRNTRYVLYNEDPVAMKRVYSKHEEFNHIVPQRKAKNENSYPYKHLYRKEKKGKYIIFDHVRTEKVK